MLLEWAAHTDYYKPSLPGPIDRIFGWDTRSQAKHVDFDIDSEELEYWEFLIEAGKRKIRSMFWG